MLRTRPNRIARRVFAATLFLGTACLNTGEPGGSPSNPATETYAPSLGVNISQMTKLSDALYIQDLVVGTGTTAATGMTVKTTYTGWIVNGTQFDSNVGKATLDFTLGDPHLIDGFNAGLIGMRVGGMRRLVIGSDLAYGPDGNGPIVGPNSTLIFEVLLVAAQ